MINEVYTILSSEFKWLYIQKCLQYENKMQILRKISHKTDPERQALKAILLVKQNWWFVVFINSCKNQIAFFLHLFRECSRGDTSQFLVPIFWLYVKHTNGPVLVLHFPGYWAPFFCFYAHRRKLSKTEHPICYTIELPKLLTITPWSADNVLMTFF